MRRLLVLGVLLGLGRNVAGDPPAPMPKSGEPAPPPAAPVPPSAQPPSPVAKPTEKPLTPEQAADAVLAAVKAKDETGLKAPAAKDDPDPWLVADELLARGEPDAADAFARAAPRKDVEKLPAYVASRRGRPDDAAARKALAAAAAALGGGDLKAALEALGAAAGEAGTVVAVRIAFARGAAARAAVRLEESAASYLAAAEAAERLGWLSRAGAALDEASRASYRRGDFRGALSAGEQLRRVEEDRGARSSAAVALANIGSVHGFLGNYAKAQELFERALKEQEALGDRAGAAHTLAVIGNVHYVLGRYAKALEVYERAWKEQDALGDRAGAARTLGNIGGVHASLGNYAKALEFHERALKEQEALGDRAGAAGTLGNIGNVHRSLGNFAKALEVYARVLKEEEALGDRAGAAMALGSIGSVHFSLGSYAKALDFHERALREKTALGDRAGAAATLANVGSVHYALGKYATAMEVFERALKEMQALGDREGAAATLGYIGNAHWSLGNYAKALEFHGRALEEQEALGNRARAATTLRDIARAREALGEPGKALEAAHRGVVLLPTLVSGLGDEQGASARVQYGELFDVGVRAAAATHDVAQVGFFLEQGRAGSLLESFSAREALRSGLLPAGLVSAEAEARAKEAAAVRAYRKSFDAGDRQAIRALRAEMESAQEAVGAVIERIQREAKRAASVLYPTAASLEAIRATLGSEEALVLYALTDTQALALVVTAKEARIAPLPSSTKEVEALCAAFDPADSAAESGSAAAALRKAVVEPLELSEDVRRILVSPDGALSYVPFAVLLGDREVAYVPSGTTYGLLREEKDLRGEGILALGDPDYVTRIDERALAVVRGGLRLARLPGTREEAKAVGTVTLLGAEASESGLRDAVAKRSRWRAVHLACHGLIDAERPAFSSLALTPDGDDDGFLTALEVFRSKIPADLVVLSACETGKGKVVKGEGIVGLTRAFMFAGAPRVICSLWKVDDEATRALMTRFYSLWNPKDGSKRMGTAAALKAAQEYVRSHEIEVPDEEATKREGHPVTKRARHWEQPYFWAAWVLWGLPD